MKDLASPQNHFNEQHMVQLSIDTCNALCAVALSKWEEGQCVLVAQDTLELGRGHAEILTKQIADLLKSSALTTADISRIAVTKGPGSFTGQRVGLATARMLAASLQVDVVGVGVLDAMLLEASAQTDKANAFCAVNDARRSAAYVKAVNDRGDVLIDDSLVLLEQLPALLQDLPTPLCLVGSAHDLVVKKKHADWISIDTALPHISYVAQLGHTLHAALNPAEPLYLRGADAKPQSAKHILRHAPNGQTESPRSML